MWASRLARAAAGLPHIVAAASGRRRRVLTSLLPRSLLRRTTAFELPGRLVEEARGSHGGHREVSCDAQPVPAPVKPGSAPAVPAICTAQGMRCFLCPHTACPALPLPRYLLEEMVPDLEALEQKGYFSRAEIKAVVQKRQVGALQSSAQTGSVLYVQR